MKKKLTLEIGSGNNPRSGADILVDRYLFDNSQRAGSFMAIVDRPFIVADGYHLPFKDKSFDFVYCSHVLEHVDEPYAFVKEIMRVGKRGYIEVPNILAERLFGWDFHLWYCEKKNNALVFTSKKEGERFGGFFHRLITKDTSLRRFFDAHENIFYIKYFWNNSINLRVSHKEKTPKEIQDIDTTLWDLIQKMDWSMQKNSIFELNFFIKRVQRKLQKIRRLIEWKITLFFHPDSVNMLLRDILRCPSCKNESLQYTKKKYSCSACKEFYPVTNTIPIFLPKKERQKGY